MLNVKRELMVARSTEEVWEFVKNMGSWAAQMPGYVSHEEISGDDSVWTLQLNLGAFSRPIVMDVHVIQWTPPTQVTFELKGRFDPFRGSGAFCASPQGEQTAISLQFEAEGTGSMGKVVSAMADPVLKYVADEFSANLAKTLEGAVTAKPRTPAQSRVTRFLRDVIRKVLAAFREAR